MIVDYDGRILSQADPGPGEKIVVGPIDLAAYRGHFFAGEQDQIRATITDSLANGYGVACSQGTTVVLHRGSNNGGLSPELSTFVGQAP